MQRSPVHFPRIKCFPRVLDLLLHSTESPAPLDRASVNSSSITRIKFLIGQMQEHSARWTPLRANRVHPKVNRKYAR